MVKKRNLVMAIGAGACLLAVAPVVVLDNVRSAYANEIALKRAAVMQPEVVLAGDSLTVGGTPWGVRLHKNPLAVVTVAKGGLTAWQLRPVVKSAAALRPKTMILTAGTNDVGSRHYDEDESVADILDLVNIARTSGAKVVVTLTPPPEKPKQAERTRHLADRLRPILSRQGVTIIDLWDEMAPTGTLRHELSRDGVHFNSAGYDVWAAKLRTVLD